MTIKNGLWVDRWERGLMASEQVVVRVEFWLEMENWKTLVELVELVGIGYGASVNCLGIISVGVWS